MVTLSLSLSLNLPPPPSIWFKLTRCFFFQGKNKIGDAGAKALFDALHDNQCVQKIDLGHNKIGTKGVEALKNLLVANKNIQSVDLSNSANLIGGPSLAGFGDLKDIDFADLVVHSV